MNNIFTNINKILSDNYPIKIKINEIDNLSHFFILPNNWNKFLPFEFDINGKILTNNKYKNWTIIKVLTNKIINWKKYLFLYISIINKHYYPCINLNKFLILLHTCNYIDILNIKKIIIKKKDNIQNIKINYISKPVHHYFWNNSINKISENYKHQNHFHFYSFNVNENYKRIKEELDRLIKNRDKYNSLHFHLDNNVGGDLVPVHLIIRCLVGKKEKWMKNIKKILKNKEILEWNCWKEEEHNSPNEEVVKKINLDFLPDYNIKYNGKIYLYISKENGSAAWFFITYIIYAFSDKIKRYQKKCYNQKVKYGTINNNNKLFIIGHSGTTSGDGNSIELKYRINNKKINILCPTEQFISCSVKTYDWNRFWTDN